MARSRVNTLSCSSPASSSAVPRGSTTTPPSSSYYEKFYFTPGDLGFQPIQTSVGRLGVQVCWDQWYPEGARLMALAGADILIYPTAIGYESSDTPEEQASWP